MDLVFEWDEEKNRVNQRKHGVSFEERVVHSLTTAGSAGPSALRGGGSLHPAGSRRFSSHSGRVSLLSGRRVRHTHHFRSEGRPRGTTSISLVAPMKKRYDFSKSVKNPYLRKPKKQLTIRLDEDTIDYFRALAEKNGVPYQNLINLYLRDCAQSGRKLSMKWE